MRDLLYLSCSYSLLSLALSLGLGLCLQLLAAFLVATMLPVLLLALCAAVVDHPAACADLVLQGRALWGTAGVAVFHVSILKRVLFRLLESLSFLLDVREPLQWGVLLPGVEVLDGVTLYRLVWAFPWSELIDEIVLLLLSEDFQSVLEVLLDELSCDVDLLLLLVVTGFLGVGQLLAESPEACVAEHWAQIDFDGLQEVFVVKSQN